MNLVLLRGGYPPLAVRPPRPRARPPQMPREAPPPGGGGGGRRRKIRFRGDGTHPGGSLQPLGEGRSPPRPTRPRRDERPINPLLTSELQESKSCGFKL